MAKDETRRWRGWRTSQPSAAIKGSQPTKQPGTRRRKKNKLHPWYWIKATKASTCGGCSREVPKGEMIAFSRPDKVLCESCVEGRGLNPKVSRKLADEREKRKRFVDEVMRRKESK